MVASPPCQAFSQAVRHKRTPERIAGALAVVEACERIAREAGAPLILENVWGLKDYRGWPRGNYGPFCLWGDGVPFLLPQSGRWDRVKMLHRSPILRAQIPRQLAEAVAEFYTCVG